MSTIDPPELLSEHPNLKSVLKLKEAQNLKRVAALEGPSSSGAGGPSSGSNGRRRGGGRGGRG